MKCINCGHELPEGNGFCDNCGMIMSLDGGENEGTAAVNDGKKDKGIDDDFMAYLYDDEPKAKELKADKTEQIVDVEEYVIPEEENEEIVSEAVASVQETEAEEVQPQTEEEAFEDISSYSEESEVAAEEEPQVEHEEESYPVYNELSEESEETEEVEEDDFDDDAIDMYVKSKSKKGSVLIAFLIVVLICVVAGGVNLIRDRVSIPVQGETTVSEEKETTEKKTTKAEETIEDETEVEETKEAETTEETTEEETTEEEITEDETDTEETTEEEITEEAEAEETKEYTEESEETTDEYIEELTEEYTAEATTKAPSTTKTPSTTKAPSTTRVPSTTKAPTTTKAPSTTKASTTTSKYGINNVKVQAPKNNITSYTGYVTVNGVTLRAKPSQDGERILYLSLGADLKVIAKENGFLYVKSNRYSVYGWVSENYVAKERKEADKIVTVPNLVKPDKAYGTATVKYVTAAEGLRLRKGPGSNYDIIRVIRKGYPVKVTGYSSKVSGWVYVTDTTHGVSGWVSSAYIK